MTPSIHLRREGPIIRLLVVPPDAMPTSYHVPSTYVSVAVARMSAKVLSDVTGFAVVDLTEARG